MSELLSVLVIVLVAVVSGLGAWWAARRFMRWRRGGDLDVSSHLIAERVSTLGRFVALEVCAKEIATATKGLAWLPPLLLSQARLAMIFHFEKQYSVNLARVRQSDVVETAPGCFRLRLPPVEGRLRLTDMTPYDIQDGRMLGLLDVIPMNAERQKELMRRAQEQASALYEANEQRYLHEARASAERQLQQMIEMFGVRVQIVWSEPGQQRTGEALEIDENSPLSRAAAAP